MSDYNEEVMSTGYSEEDIANNKWYAFASYWGILVLIPILGAKNSPYAKFHANQGLNLLIVNFVVNVLNNLIDGFLSIALSIVSLVIFVFAVMGMVNAVKGRAKELPIIGKIKLLK